MLPIWRTVQAILSVYGNPLEEACALRYGRARKQNKTPQTHYYWRHALRKNLLLATAAVAAIATPAFAQDAETPTDVADNADVQGPANAPIVVVAQGREQRLIDVPIAVNAVSAESLQNSGANDIRQLNQLAPSLLVSSTGSEANGSARIRGIGTVGDNPGLESSVAVFIDGVYRSRTGVGLNELGEIERVEVLRGPQGTLFGRNASAGLINIISRAPDYTPEFNAEATYGNYDHIRVAAGATGPIGNSGLAYRIDGVYVNRDGFYQDTLSGQDVNDRDRYFVRGQLAYEASPDLEFRLIGDYTRREENCCAAVYATPALAPANAGLLDLTNPIIPVLLEVANVSYDTYFPSRNDPYERDIAITPGRTYAGTTEDYGVSLQADWDLGFGQLTSITAYREYRSEQGTDTDYGVADILYNADNGENFRSFQTFSQELRLQGEAFDGRLDWLVGGYYAHEELDTGSNLRFGNDYGAFASCRLLATINPGLPRAAAAPGCLAPAIPGVFPGTAGILSGIFPDPDGAGPIQGAAPFIDGLNRLSTVNDLGDVSSRYSQTSENFALFTHNIFEIADGFDLTVGLRYTTESKDFSANFNNDNTICPAQQAALLPFLTGAAQTTVPSSLIGGLIALACQGNSTAQLNGLNLVDDRNEDEFTGTAILSYRPVDDLLLYASYSHGYKAGGFNLDRSALTAGPGSVIFPVTNPASGFSTANLQFDAETVDAFEIGAKYEGRDFTISAAAFRQEFSNFQLNTFNGTVFIVQNVNGCGADLGGADRDGSAATGACAADDVEPGVISQGVELEATLTPADYWRFGLGMTFADTSYANNLVGDDQGTPLDPALRLLPGDNLSNAPELVVTGSAAWTPPIGNSGLSALFYVDTRVTSDYNTGSDLTPTKEQDGFVLVNARVGIRDDDQLWSLEFWGQNIFNTGYSQVAFNSPFQAPAQIYSAFLAEPRTYGVTLRTRF